MNNFDLVIANIMIALAKGDYPNALYSPHKYKESSIEARMYPNGRAPFPTDVLLFSRHHNHFLLLEAKDTTTTELDTDQAASYEALDISSFRDLGYRFESAQLSWDASYIGHNENIEHLRGEISSHGVALPLLVFDKVGMTIKRVDQNSFSEGYLNTLFDQGIKIPVAGPDKVTQYVHFSPQSDAFEVISAVVPNLASPQFMPTARYSDLAKASHSSVRGLWDGIAADKKRELEKIVKRSLQTLRDSGLQSELTIENDHCSLDIQDTHGRFSPQKAGSIMLKVESAKQQLRQQQPLF